jgi:hypothetical protein
MSQREVARRVAISQSSIAELPMKINFILIISPVRGLKKADYPKGLNFCRTKIILDVVFSDEASFSNNGGVNKYNCHYYAPNTPCWIREGHFQTIYVFYKFHRTIFFRI